MLFTLGHSDLYLGPWDYLGGYVFFLFLKRYQKSGLEMKKRVNHNNFGNCLLFSFSPKERNDKCLKRFGFKTSLSLCCLYLYTFSSSLKGNVLCDNELFFPLKTCVLGASKNNIP